MTKYYNTKEFEALHKEWQKKLEDSGFVDVEQADGHLKQYHASLFRRKKTKTFNSTKKEYYRIAGQFLHMHRFKNQLEHDIWSAHCVGKSFREIGEVKNISEQKVRRTVERIRKIMYITVISEDDNDNRD